MPHHASEENAPSNLTDKVAQESTDAPTSDHPMHAENKGPISHGSDAGSGSVTAEAHKSKGPQISDDMPGVEGTKEELQAKAKELNKK